VKTIEEGVLEHIHNTIGEFLHKDQSFKAGVEFAQRWIPVEEEFPEDSDSLTETEKYTYTENSVLVRTINGKYTVSKRSKFKQNKDSKWEWMGSSSFSDSVTHWRPIELK